MAKIRQDNAFPPGVYRGIPFTREDIKQYVESTNRAINEAKIPVPLLAVHAPINANDTETAEFAKKEGKGWVTQYFQNPDTGALGFEADNVPDDFHKAIVEKTVKLTSPEFRRNYESEKAGTFQGKMIRHMAFTPLPGNPHQGPIETIALSELGVFQFSELDLDENPKKVSGDYSDVDNVDEHEDDLKKKKKKDSDKEEDSCDSQHAESKSKKPNIYHALHDRDVPAFESLVKKHGGVKVSHQDEDTGEHSNNTYHVPKSKHAALKSDAQSLGFHHGDHYGNFGASQHAEENELVPGKKKKDPAEFSADQADVTTPDNEITPENPPPESGTEAKNPDAPPKATDKSKMSAIRSGLAQKNIVVPSDWDFQADSAEDILLGCINSAIAAENSTDAEDDDADDEESPPQETSMPFSESGLTVQFYEDSSHHHALTKAGFEHVATGQGGWSHHYEHPDSGAEASIDFTHSNDRNGKLNATASVKKKIKKHYDSQHSEITMQFSEEELSAMTPKVRAIVEANEKRRIEDAKAKQYAEEQRAIAQADLAKFKAVQFIEKKKLPPAIATKLKQSVGTLQFSEGVEPKTFTASQVAEMIDAHLPKEMQFAEEELEEAPTPKGVDSTQFFEDGSIPKGHVGDQRAEELVKNNPLFKNLPSANGIKSLTQSVAEENARNPNLVMRS